MKSMLGSLLTLFWTYVRVVSNKLANITELFTFNINIDETISGIRNGKGSDSCFLISLFPLQRRVTFGRRAANRANGCVANNFNFECFSHFCIPRYHGYEKVITVTDQNKLFQLIILTKPTNEVAARPRDCVATILFSYIASILVLFNYE